jgi:hypothetical protein
MNTETAALPVAGRPLLTARFVWLACRRCGRRLCRAMPGTGLSEAPRVDVVAELKCRECKTLNYLFALDPVS